MKTILALALVALLNSGVPNTESPDGVGFAQCQDESVIMLEKHEKGVAAYRQGSTTPYVFVDPVNREVYVYSLRKWLTIDEAKQKWPTLCEVPGDAGV